MFVCQTLAIFIARMVFVWSLSGLLDQAASSTCKRSRYAICTYCWFSIVIISLFYFMSSRNLPAANGLRQY